MAKVLLPGDHTSAAAGLGSKAPNSVLGQHLYRSDRNKPAQCLPFVEQKSRFPGRVRDGNEGAMTWQSIPCAAETSFGVVAMSAAARRRKTACKGPSQDRSQTAWLRSFSGRS